MPRYAGLRITGWVLLVAGLLFYVTSVAGLFWPKPTPWYDVGLYSVTLALVGFGGLTLFLRHGKLHPGEPE